MNTNLQAYAAMRTRPVPPGMKPGTPFDPFDAAPIAQTPQGAVQMGGPVRQQGLVPGTLYGGLVDTRYAKGLEPLMSPTAPARPVDIDLASGVPEHTRMQQYAALRGALDTIEKKNLSLGNRQDGEALDRRAVRAGATTTLEGALAEFLRTQQIPEQKQFDGAYAVASGKGKLYQNMLKEQRTKRRGATPPAK